MFCLQRLDLCLELLGGQVLKGEEVNSLSKKIVFFFGESGIFGEEFL